MTGPVSLPLISLVVRGSQKVSEAVRISPSTGLDRGI